MKTINKATLVLAGLLAFCASASAQKSHDFKTHEIRVGISPVPFWATLGGFEDRERKGVLEEIYGDKEGKIARIPAAQHFLQPLSQKLVLAEHQTFLLRPVQLHLHRSRLLCGPS